MAQKFQMVQIDSNGSAIVFHPETDADHVLTGATKEVPTSSNIADWKAKSSELIAARKGQANLKAKIDLIDNALVPAQLLSTIKTVDGSGSGLDADTVDGKGVDDSSNTNSSLWTASKTLLELNKKANNTDIVATAAPNKVLRLNASSLLPAGITGNSATTTRLKDQLTINVTGDVSGSISFTGSEKTISTNLRVSQLTNLSDTIQIVNNNLSNEIVRLNDELQIETNILDNKISTLADELMNATVVSDEEIVMLGGLKVKYGTVNIGDLSSIDIIFSKPFTKILYDGLSIESLDNGLNIVKAPGTLNNSGIGYNFNRTALVGSKLTWFVVGQ